MLHLACMWSWNKMAFISDSDMSTKIRILLPRWKPTIQLLLWEPCSGWEPQIQYQPDRIQQDWLQWAWTAGKGLLSDTGLFHSQDGGTARRILGFRLEVRLQTTPQIPRVLRGEVPTDSESPKRQGPARWFRERGQGWGQQKGRHRKSCGQS